MWLHNAAVPSAVLLVAAASKWEFIAVPTWIKITIVIIFKSPNRGIYVPYVHADSPISFVLCFMMLSASQTIYWIIWIKRTVWQNAVLSSVVSPALKYFPTFSHKRHNFLKKKVTEYKMCVLILSITFVWDISHSKKKWARYDKKFTLVLM